MNTPHELTDAAGTPERPLPGSPVLTARDDDTPRSGYTHYPTDHHHHHERDN